MRFTAQLLAGFVVVTCLVSAATVHAGKNTFDLYSNGNVRGQSPAPRPTAFSGRQSAFAEKRSTENSAVDKKQMRSRLLFNARLELSKRNTSRAADLANQAKAISGAFSPLGDSPERVETLIRRHHALDTGNARNFQNPEFRRQYARFLMDQSVGLLNYKQYDRAEALAREAKRLQPEFPTFEQTPDKLLAKIVQQKRTETDANAKSAVVRPSSVATAGGGQLNGNVRRAALNDADEQLNVRRSDDIPELDRTRNVPAGAEQEPKRAPQTGPEWYQKGLQALTNNDKEGAFEAFKKAWEQKEQLNPNSLQDLRVKLNWLRPKRAEPIPNERPTSNLDRLDQDQRLVLQRLERHVLRERDAAEGMQSTDPRGALRRMERLHDRVAGEDIPKDHKRQWLIIVDRSISDMQQFIDENRAQIETDEINRSRFADVEQRRERTIEVQDELAQLVEKFNELMDQNRYLEARVIARQAKELAPDAPVTETLIWKSKFVGRIYRQMDIRDRKEAAFIDTLVAVDEASISFGDDYRPFRHGDASEWRHLSEDRLKRARDRSQRMTVEEIKIHQALREKKIKVSFTKRPLREVIDFLGDLAGVNIHLDQKGLIAEGVASDQPVTINLRTPISLKSVLNILLKELNLAYVVQDEVINVTSISMRNENVYQKVYYVADLVIPIPNFVPSYNIGLSGALAQAHQAIGYGGTMPGSGSMLYTAAANPGGGSISPIVSNPYSAQMLGQARSMGGVRAPRPNGYGPSGLGGGPQADFDSLIQLITSTIEPESWDEVGGPGSVESFEANLSLVVSQTQEVHDQIANLLDQLRRLQDLQVTIELRFVTVNDNFFEFIGIDFDFDIDDNTGLTGSQDPALTVDDAGPSRFFGLGADGEPTADLDLSFLQGSVAAVTPAFGGFDPNTAATFGFAILSDIEVFFLLTAAQGNERSNVVEAPKATLFNGQQATISDTSQQPFVTSVIPVVGDFAAAHQPVIIVLSEGTSLSIQAVVSADRRYVRLTLVPFFSTIGEVKEFTFTGKKTIISGGGLSDPTTGAALDDDARVTIIEGTTVQFHNGDDDGQCARRRHGVAGRNQTFERGAQRGRRPVP